MSEEQIRSLRKDNSMSVSQETKKSNLKIGCLKNIVKHILDKCRNMHIPKLLVCFQKVIGLQEHHRLRRKVALLAKVQDEAGHGSVPCILQPKL